MSTKKKAKVKLPKAKKIKVLKIEKIPPATSNDEPVTRVELEVIGAAEAPPIPVPLEFDPEVAAVQGDKSGFVHWLKSWF